MGRLPRPRGRHRLAESPVVRPPNATPVRERPRDGSGVHVWLVLMKAHRSMVRHAERSIVSLDMCISDFGVLEVLLHKGPQSVSEIGRRVDLTSGSITTAIDRLEQRGLVARAAHASDRRARVVHLTPDGRARITEVFGKHKDAMERAALGLSKVERDTLIELLKKLGITAELQFTEGDGNHDNHAHSE
jgi:MarR family transcriptional regulator, 2-MHQ and catechol-resistance regulon repressor